MAKRKVTRVYMSNNTNWIYDGDFEEFELMAKDDGFIIVDSKKAYNVSQIVMYKEIDY